MSKRLARKRKHSREVDVSQVLEQQNGDDKLTSLHGARLGDSFFNVPCEALAHDLLGKILTRVLENGKRLSGRIVETECYLGGDDKASWSYQGKKTPANSPMFMKPGTAFVYMTYGMYYCFNISSQGEGAAVLLRALEPLEGLDHMKENRGAKRKDGGESLKDKDLCNGPSKLCQAMKINKELMNEKDLATCDAMWIEQGDQVSPDEIVSTSRIGIGPSTGVWMKKALRFYIRGNTFVSNRDKKAEAF